VVAVRAKDGLGRYGERVAAAHLEAAGLTILERNWRCDLGEIDIVAREGDTLVICEVKTRSGLGFGSPLEGVTPVKVLRLRRLAGRWLATHPQRASEVRIDLVGVLRPRRGAALVEHVRGAV
jgi:putative endonuclease